MVLLMAYTIFGPIIDGTLSGIALEAITGPGDMGVLATNAGSLKLTVSLILMIWKVFAFFIIFAVLSRLFLWSGYLSEEQGVY